MSAPTTADSLVIPFTTTACFHWHGDLAILPNSAMDDQIETRAVPLTSDFGRARVATHHSPVSPLPLIAGNFDASGRMPRKKFRITEIRTGLRALSKWARP